MKMTNIKTGATRLVKMTGLKLKKASPEILLVTGVVSIVGGTVLACKATLKADEVLDIHEQCLENIEKATELETYSDSDRKQDLVITYVQTAGRFMKLYGPSVLLIGGGIGCIMASHGIMRKRNAALMTAYTALDNAFKDYRKRAAKAIGTEEEEKIYLNADEVQKETFVDPKTGETHEIVTATGEHVTLSQYAKCFDEKSLYWKRDSETNKSTLLFIQNHMNDLLRINGHVFLNEVYDALDIPRTTEGALVGWVLGSGMGDDYIDFGIFNIKSEASRDFVNGYEKSIWLDFNVQGPIYNLI